MNILYITHENSLGGANQSLLGIIDNLNRDNNNISVLVRRRKGYIINELEKRHINIIFCPYFCWIFPLSKRKLKSLLQFVLHFMATKFNYILATLLKYKINLKSIDVIHTNSMVVNFGGILAKKNNIVHIWHIREFVIEHLDYKSIYSWEKTFKYMNQNSNRIVVISSDLLHYYNKAFNNKKMSLIHNGIDSKNKFLKQKFNSECINFLISGAICAEKGQMVAVKAIGILVKEGYYNIHLSIAGHGKTDDLRQFINMNSLDKYITFCGQVKDMMTLRKRMDIELVCSKREGFGRVTVEAMMSTMPVIGANTGGTLDIIIPEFNGLLYSQGSCRALAERMKTFLNNPSLIKDYGNNAYHYVLDRFTAEVNAKKLSALYNECINDKF